MEPIQTQGSQRRSGQNNGLDAAGAMLLADGKADEALRVGGAEVARPSVRRPGWARFISSNAKSQLPWAGPSASSPQARQAALQIGPGVKTPHRATRARLRPRRLSSGMKSSGAGLELGTCGAVLGRGSRSSEAEPGPPTGLTVLGQMNRVCSAASSMARAPVPRRHHQPAQPPARHV